VIRRRDPVLGGHAKHHQEGVDQKDEPSTWTQQPRGFRHPLLRLGPQAGSILGNREIKAGIRIRDRFGVAVQEGEGQPILLLQPARRG